MLKHANAVALTTISKVRFIGSFKHLRCPSHWPRLTRFDAHLAINVHPLY